MEFYVQFLFLLIIVPIGNSQEDLVVITKSGPVQGSKLTGDRDVLIYSFQGIPYAEPPVGALRFKPPVPANPWTEVRDATQEGPTCIQFNWMLNRKEGVEDCLVLNVYTPQIPQEGEESTLPVMVWIHGGGFQSGSGGSDFYGPQKLVHKGVVLVTINYRLGLFGFLSTHDSVAPGNVGLLDQVSALQWVQNNIAAFGGHPDRVTIFGESAGGASVSLHVISPLSSGLFNRAIIQSGSALCPWVIQQNPKRAAEEFASLLDCPTGETQQLVDCLRYNKTADEIIDMAMTQGTEITDRSFTPVIEKYGTGAGFLTDAPKKLLEKGKFNKVNVMIGAVKDEGILFYGRIQDIVERGQKGFLKKVLPKVLKTITQNKNELEKVQQHVEHFYFNHIQVHEIFVEQVIAFYTDFYFTSPMTTEVQQLAKYIQPYVYKVSHRGQFSLSPLFGVKKNVGVCHGDELQYLFGGALFPNTDSFDRSDARVARLMQTLWTNFAKTGAPTKTKEMNPFMPMTAPDKSHLFEIKEENSGMKIGPLCKLNIHWEKYIPEIIVKARRIRDEL